MRHAHERMTHTLLCAQINQLLVVGRDAVEQAKAKVGRINHSSLTDASAAVGLYVLHTLLPDAQFMDKRQQIIVEEVAIASGRPSESPM